MGWVLLTLILIQLSVFVGSSNLEDHIKNGYWAVCGLVVIVSLVLAGFTS